MLDECHRVSQTGKDCRLFVARHADCRQGLVAIHAGRYFLRVVPQQVVGAEVQRSRSDQPRIELPDSTGSKVTWVRELRLALFAAVFVQFREIFFEHDDLAADFRAADEKLFVTLRTHQPEWHVRDRPDVVCHVFPDETVASRNRLYQYAVLVYQCTGKTIHLYVREELVLATRQQFVHAFHPGFYLVSIKDVVQAQHARTVRHFDKATLQLVTDALRRTVGRDQLRLCSFQLLQLSKQAVIHRVTDGWRIEHMVFVAIPVEKLSEFGYAFIRPVLRRHLRSSGKAGTSNSLHRPPSPLQAI